MGFGDYPAEYKPQVHGPYDPARYYGKRKYQHALGIQAKLASSRGEGIENRDHKESTLMIHLNYFISIHTCYVFGTRFAP